MADSIEESYAQRIGPNQAAQTAGDELLQRMAATQPAETPAQPGAVPAAAPTKPAASDQPAASGGNDLTRPFRIIGQNLVYVGPTHFFDFLDQMASLLGKVGVKNHGGLFKKIADLSRVQDNQLILPTNFPEKVLGQVSEAITGQLPKLALATAAGGPIGGFAALNAAEAASKGASPLDITLEAVKGALTGGAFESTAMLTRGARAAATALIGAGTAAAQGAKPEDIAASAATMGILGASGPAGTVTGKEALKAAVEPVTTALSKRSIAQHVKKVEAAFEAAKTATATQPPDLIQTKSTTSAKAKDFLDQNPSAVVVGDKALKINWANVGDPATIDSIVKTITKLHEGQIDVARRGVQSDVLTKQLANDLGLSVDQLLSRQTGQALNAEQTQAYIDVYGASLKELKNLTTTAQAELTNGVVSPQTDIAFRRQLGITTAITEQIFGARAEAGRSLRIWGTTAQDVRTGMGTLKQEAEILTAGRTMADVPTERLVEMMSSLERPEQVATFMRSLSKGHATVNAIMEAWVNGLLTNPVTHVVNTASNTIVTTLGVAERAMAAGGRQLTSKLGLTKETDGVVHGEGSALLSGLMGGYQDALRMAWQAFKSGQSQRGVSKVDIPRRAISAEAFDLNASGTVGRAVDLLGEAVRTPGRFLTSADDFFKSINYRMELHAQAWREAVKDGGTSEQMGQRYQQILSDPPTKITEVAESFANYQTFTNELNGTDIFSAAGRATLRFANDHPLARVIVPFVRTPTNIFKYTLERTPGANLMLSNVREDIAAGGVRRDLVLAKTAMGGMIMGVGAYLAAQGHITGGGPENKELRNIKRQTGWQPYSIRVGDAWYSYNRFDPIGSLLGVVANFHEISGELDQATADQLAMAGVMAFKDAFLYKTYLTGIASVVEAINSPDRAAHAWSKQMAGSVVPAGVAQVQRTLDPTLRETITLMDQIRSRIPGLSASLPPRRNLWGEPIVLEGGLGPDLISPFYSSTRKDDPVAEEMVRLELPIGLPPEWIGGSRPSQSILGPEKLGQGVWLSPEQYSRLQILAGNELKVGGLGMRDRLEQMIVSPSYLRQSDDGKKILLYSTVHQYREAAQQQLMKEYPELKQMAIDIQKEKADALKPTGIVGLQIGP